MEISKLEQDVLDLFIAENAERYPQLRDQVASAVVESRRLTGYGFFTEIDLPLDIPKIPRDFAFFIALVCAELKDGRALGFSLFLQDGLITTLEGFAYERKWPDDVGEYKLSYHRSTGRVIASDEQTKTKH